MRKQPLANLRWPSTLLLSVAVCVASPVTGCRSNPAPGDANAAGRRYTLKGIVVSTDPAKGEVSVDSQTIPGFMEGMIMPYKLRQPNTITELHAGDHITAQLLVSPTNTLLDQVVVTQQAQPDYKPAVVYNVPKPGEPVPNFKLLNQSGRTIDIDQFRGKVLLLTFIYTRCPLADYCPRMSRNFAEIDRDLATNPQLYAQTHLLSISFDPVYDTPAVLRSYGGAYTGKYTKESFAHWDFAAPEQGELKKVEEFFDLGVTAGPNQTLTHSLSTVVIDRDGKVFAWYPTNDWNPADVLRDVKKALGEPAQLADSRDR